MVFWNPEPRFQVKNARDPDHPTSNYDPRSLALSIDFTAPFGRVTGTDFQEKFSLICIERNSVRSTDREDVGTDPGVESQLSGLGAARYIRMKAAGRASRESGAMTADVEVHRKNVFHRDPAEMAISGNGNDQ